MRAPVLTFKNISFRWKPNSPDVLSNISFSIKEGERVALLGLSGIGKTTLAKIAVGLIRPTGGVIELRPSAVGASAVDIAFQNNTLLPWLNIAENVMFGAGKKSRKLTAEAIEILNEVGLMHAAGLRPSDLSGGMRQRASVARAILRKCQLTILDEPFSALDLLTRDALYGLIARTSRAYSIAYLIVTHLPEDVYSCCNRCLILNNYGHNLEEIELSDYTNFESFRYAVLQSLSR